MNIDRFLPEFDVTEVVEYHVDAPPAVTYEALLDTDLRDPVIDALFAATWGGGPGVEQPEIVARLATEVGLDGPDIVAQAQSPAAKERLRSQTDEALRAGVFGVPTILIGDELFWGYDSFPDVEQHLRGEDPVSATALARWADIPATARR